MKFKADRQTLIDGISTVIRSVPNRCTIPIFECILIESYGRGLTLTANDMEQAIETHVDAEIEETGSVAVDAKLFFEIIRKMPDRDIKFVSDEKFNIKLSAGKSKFSVSGRDGSEFTGIPDIGDADSYAVPQGLLREMIQTTIFAADASGDNRVMNGLCFEVNDGFLSLTALDGHRIARRRASIGNVSNCKVIIPSKALGDISKLLLSEYDESVIVSITDNHASFEFDNTIMVVRLVGGTYFDIDRMLSKDYQTFIKAEKDQLVSCMERALLFTREGNKKPIVLDIENDEIRFSINSQTGNMTETLDAYVEGNALTIGFNPKFMLDALKAVPEDMVEMRMINKKSPCYITDSEGSYMYLVLPVQFVR